MDLRAVCLVRAILIDLLWEIYEHYKLVNDKIRIQPSFHSLRGSNTNEYSRPFFVNVAQKRATPKVIEKPTRTGEKVWRGERWLVRQKKKIEKVHRNVYISTECICTYRRLFERFSVQNLRPSHVLTIRSSVKTKTNQTNNMSGKFVDNIVNVHSNGEALREREGEGERDKWALKMILVEMNHVSFTPRFAHYVTFPNRSCRKRKRRKRIRKGWC